MDSIVSFSLEGIVRHCNSVFKPYDIWFLLDSNEGRKRKIYIANCPICNKEIALYSHLTSDGEYFEKYYYSGGAKRIKEKLKKDVTSTMLGFKTKYKSPYGFKYGENKEIIKKGKVVGVKQYACDFWGNKILVKKIENG